MHGALEKLYRERPGSDPVPRRDSLPLWIERGLELVAEVAAERELDGTGAAERAVRRRVAALLVAFLRREADRDPVLLEPELLEAGFGAGMGDGDEETAKPSLDLGELVATREDRPGRRRPLAGRRPGGPAPRLQV